MKADSEAGEEVLVLVSPGTNDSRELRGLREARNAPTQMVSLGVDALAAAGGPLLAALRGVFAAQVVTDRGDIFGVNRVELHVAVSAEGRLAIVGAAGVEGGIKVVIERVPPP